MRILVTGGAGFIGSHLTDLLTTHGHDVLVVDNLRTGNADNLRTALATNRVRFERADILEPGRLAELAETFRPEVIVHLAALVSVQEARQVPDENFRLNLAATQAVITAAQRSHARRIVFASSAAVYGDNERLPLQETEPLTPLSLYGGAKAASELLLACSGRDLGFDTVALRFFNVFGTRQRPDSPYSGVISIFADRARRGDGVTIFGDGTQSRDFIAVTDVARALLSAIEHPKTLSGAFNVCTGRRTTLLDLVAGLQRVVGREIAVTLKPARAGDILHSLGNPQALQTATGFVASAELDQGLAALLR